MFKIAMNAGHWLGTDRGVPANLSPIGRRVDEWTLNNRICDKVEQRLTAYNGYELLRIDDTTGANDIKLEDRTGKANAWGADFYLGVHHNGGVNGGKGGGIVAYTYTDASDESRAWRKELYDALIAHTGLKGNRSQPLAAANLHECRETAMPAVLLELGFMDSVTDIPVILSEEFADASADAIVEVLVRRGGLTKKPEAPGKLYRVQVGAFRNRDYAAALREKLDAEGYDAFIVEVEA